jgi:hypothetical protein
MLVSYHITIWCHNPEDNELIFITVKIPSLAPVKSVATKVRGSRRYEIQRVGGPSNQEDIVYGVVLWESVSVVTTHHMMCHRRYCIASNK